MSKAYLATTPEISQSRKSQILSAKAILSAMFALLLGAVMFLSPARAFARAGAAGQVSVGISVSFGPPPLPVYTQPMCPGPGYIWTPGYWAWDPAYGYYWVPGTWVLAPFRGALWTPGYWGWDPGRAVFLWHVGYWGPVVGFYGGIDYGFGYPGRGYYGGFWRDNMFYYNRDANRINYYNIHNVYYQRAPRFFRTRCSYNGGDGGINARPDRRDFMAERQRRMGPSNWQDRQEHMARGMPEMRWSQNRGRPRIAATSRPERFMGRGVVRASRGGGNYRFQRQADQHRFQNAGWHQFNGQAGRHNQGGFRPQGQRNFRNAPQQRNQQQRQRYQQQRNQAGWHQFNGQPGRQNQGGFRSAPQQRNQQQRQPRYQQQRNGQQRYQQQQQRFQRQPQQRYGQAQQRYHQQQQRFQRQPQQRYGQAQQRYRQQQQRSQQFRQQRNNNYRQMRQQQGARQQRFYQQRQGGNRQRPMRPQQQQRGGNQRGNNNRGKPGNPHGHGHRG